MMFFDVKNIAFEFANYPISYIEIFATLFGLLSVYFASRGNILTWSTGIINEFFLFILFFQFQLYADMFLQVYFFIITIYGWYSWKKRANHCGVSSISLKAKILLLGAIILATFITGSFFANIHLYFPYYFGTEAEFPFVDSFIMILSIIATALLAQKKIETWYLWVVVDVASVFLFLKKDILFLGLEYSVFLGLAIYGLLNWSKEIKND